jgi:hypothetical protein
MRGKVGTEYNTSILAMASFPLTSSSSNRYNRAVEE